MAPRRIIAAPLPPAPHPELDCPLDDVALGPELSVRIMRVLENYGHKTLRDVAEKYDLICKHYAGLGRKSHDEIADAIDHACREQRALFETPEYRAHQMEDKMVSIQALLQDVERLLLQAALKGRVYADTRRHVAFKLRDAAEYVERLPINTGD